MRNRWNIPMNFNKILWDSQLRAAASPGDAHYSRPRIPNDPLIRDSPANTMPPLPQNRRPFSAGFAVSHRHAKPGAPERGRRGTDRICERNLNAAQCPVERKLQPITKRCDPKQRARIKHSTVPAPAHLRSAVAEPGATSRDPFRLAALRWELASLTLP